MRRNCWKSKHIFVSREYHLDSFDFDVWFVNDIARRNYNFSHYYSFKVKEKIANPS